MTIRNKHPGNALQRVTGANFEELTVMNPSTNSYANLGEIQSRHVMRRCGVERHKASLIKGLCYGEDGR